MSPRTALAWVGLSILLAAGLEATPARAQTAQGKTHVGGKPSGLVSLFAAVSAGGVATATVVTPEGGSEAFELPAGTVLVVTDLYGEGPGAAGIRFLGICTDGVCSDAVLRLSFDTNQELGRSLTLTSGVVFRAPPQVACFPSSDGSCTVRIYGYLAKDR